MNRSTCYISAMLPSPLSDWIQRFSTNLVLVVVALALPLVPARHVLMPLWPRTIDEVILAAADDHTGQRLFIETGRLSLRDGIVARDRPDSLVVVERFGDVPVTGFLLALRSSPEGPLQRLPDVFEADRITGPGIAPGRLVLALADDSTVEIATENIRRVYRPNRLDASQRIALLWIRLVEQLQESMFPRGRV
ncbi:MAG: hypothetical protein V2J10_07250 [Wenzhouxiangella sp.]|nr:hypothetical protein [Wenzhouxiangella sp.]